MNRENYTTPIKLHNYQIEDDFWSKRIDIVKEKMLPYQWNALNDLIEGAEQSHCIKNFKIAAGLEQGKFEGCVFQDSDVAKWLEAVGYTLIWNKDEKLERMADEVIDLIVMAQRPDGYMDTYYIINGLDKRWTDLKDNHELYCAGHMIEAGIAYYEGTGKRKLLDAVIRLADCVDRTFGAEPEKLHAYPGHEIIEMALVRLYHLTREKRYLKLAEYFINERGKKPLYFEKERQQYNNRDYWRNGVLEYRYYQADRPVREQQEAEGHAVRAVYLYSGMTAVAKEVEDESLWRASSRLWDNVTRKQMYITGAIGSSEYGEAFSFDYDLPNDLVYGETCASIGLIFWARRMLEVQPKSEYADIMERALYNTCLSGVSLDGTRFFYVNPLEVDPKACKKNQQKHHVATTRQAWFACACCPPNLARLFASIGKYAVTLRKNGMYIHLYIGGTIQDDTDETMFHIRSGLPWDGTVEITFEGEKKEEFDLALRVPEWAGEVHFWLNEQEVRVKPESDGYVHIRRAWNHNDKVTMVCTMPVRINYANPKVSADVGKVALSRGPIIYCLEEKDNGEGLQRIFLNTNVQPQIIQNHEFDGAVLIMAEGKRLSEEGWEDCLYASEMAQKYEKQELQFIPYYLWNNRGEGEMTVWVRSESK